MVFDADETLLDLRPAVTGGLIAVLDEMRRRTPAAAEVTLDSRAERCGLAGQFAFEVYAHENGLPKKPALEFYAAVVSAAGVPAEQIVYVGDSWEHDVVAPQRAGLRSVWLNRAGLPRPLGHTPDAEVSTVADLSTALALLC
ncbi:HAD family hydrolase [Micromonospora chokoriensis]